MKALRSHAPHKAGALRGHFVLTGIRTGCEETDRAADLTANSAHGGGYLRALPATASHHRAEQRVTA